MTPLEKMSEEDFEHFERHALAILQRELGLARFLRLNRAGTSNHTRDRHLWLEGTTIDEIMAAVNRPGNPPV